MATIAQAFEGFLSGLELTEAERANASRQLEVVRENLRTHLGGVDRSIVSGSFGRSTAIRPLNDIDIFLTLNEATHSHLRRLGPSSCLQAVRDALVKAYPTIKDPPTLQGRSVNIVFRETGIGYDVVPAFLTGPDAYIIPDRERTNWIGTNPEAHKLACTAANERAGKKLIPLIKAAKHWNTQKGKPLASFHLEVMAYQAFPTPPISYADGLRALFVHLAERILISCPNPAGVGPNIDAGMAQDIRSRAGGLLREAAASAVNATKLDAAGRTEEAHGVWWTLLGRPYAERGR